MNKYRYQSFSSVKLLIAPKKHLHNMCVYGVYLYTNTYTYNIYFENIYIIYNVNIYEKNILYMHACMCIYIYT